MKVLAGDVGGTNTRLALCEVNDGKVLRLVQSITPSASHESLAEIVRAFATNNGADDVRAVCFGLPGPVRGRRAQLTNLPWTVDADELERELGLPTVNIINDLEANAHGLSTLADADFKTLRTGSAVSGGNAGLVSAGTGLGEAGMHFFKGRMVPFATEGGHTDFAPSDDLEFELHQWLQARHGHVSWERVVSGPGVASLYEFFVQRAGADTPQWWAEAQQSKEPAAAIATAAEHGEDEHAAAAIELFMKLYGAEAGNFALKVLALGGIYLGGGIAPKLAKVMADSGFIERFDAKGRMRHLVEQMPIRIVLNDSAALQGAALYAARHAEP
ncbi:MAG: glucokinase [Myxococcota bacterium]